MEEIVQSDEKSRDLASRIIDLDLGISKMISETASRKQLIELRILDAITKGFVSPYDLDRHLGLLPAGTLPFRRVMLKEGLIVEKRGSNPRFKELSITEAGQAYLKTIDRFIAGSFSARTFRQEIVQVGKVEAALVVLSDFFSEKRSR